MLAKGDLKYWVIERACGKGIPLFSRKPGRSFRLGLQMETATWNPRSNRDELSIRQPQALPDANLSHLYIDLNRFAENSISASTCVFENLNSQQQEILYELT